MFSTAATVSLIPLRPHLIGVAMIGDEGGDDSGDEVGEGGVDDGLKVGELDGGED